MAWEMASFLAALLLLSTAGAGEASCSRHRTASLRRVSDGNLGALQDFEHDIEVQG